jgi:hypothetical protein
MLAVYESEFFYPWRNCSLHTCMFAHVECGMLLQERMKIAMEKLERDMEQRAAHDKFLLNQVCYARLRLVGHTHDAVT